MARYSFPELLRLLPPQDARQPIYVNPRKSLGSDIPAGIVVFLVALPLCLGIALASGAPLFAGIVSGVVGGIVVGLLGGSALSVSGPAAGLVTIVLAAISDLGAFEVFLAAVVVAGLMQIFLALVRAGVFAVFFPSSVIKGMLAAIGLILILGQLPHAVGFDRSVEGDFSYAQRGGEHLFSDLFEAITYFQKEAIIIAVVSLAILILYEQPFLKRISFLKWVPGPLVVVLMGALLNHFFFASAGGFTPLTGNHLVELPVLDSLANVGSLLRFPQWDAFLNPKIYAVAATLAAVSTLESLLSLEATDRLDVLKRVSPPNRELLAQGIGNTLSGLLGGLPVTAVLVRSSANATAGGRTRVSAIVHGVLLAGTVVLIPRVLNYIPLASLAAVLLVIGYKLTRIGLFRQMLKLGKSQYLPFLVTIVGIMLTDLLKGVGMGLAVALLFILRNNYRLPYSFDPKALQADGKVHIELAEDVSFLNKGVIQRTLQSLPNNSKVLIDGTNSRTIDYDVLELLADFREQALTRNIELEFLHVEGLPETISLGH